MLRNNMSSSFSLQWLISYHTILCYAIRSNLNFSLYHDMIYHILSCQIVSNQIKSNQIKSNQIKSNQSLSYQIISHHLSHRVAGQSRNGMNRHESGIHDAHRINLSIPDNVVNFGIDLAISAIVFPSCCIRDTTADGDVGAIVGADVEKDTDHHLHRMKLFIQPS